MALKAFRAVRTRNDDVQELQSALQPFVQDVRSRQVVDGRIVSGIVLVTGQPNIVVHKLDREPVGYMVIRASAAANVYDAQASNITPAQTLDLRTSANVTVSIWVF